MNLTGGEGRTIAYSSFNMPVSITQGTNTLSFSHDPDHQRFKQVAPEGTTLYMAAFGILVEKFSGTGGPFGKLRSAVEPVSLCRGSTGSP